MSRACRGTASAIPFPKESGVFVSKLFDEGSRERTSRAGRRSGCLSRKKSKLAIMRFDEGRVEGRAGHWVLHPVVFLVILNVKLDMFLEPLTLSLVMVNSNVRRARVRFRRRLAIRVGLKEILVLNTLREPGEPRCKAAHRALKVRD